ncbi:MAG: hypothetical protein JWR26_1760 [Pedosphaera sp.]|nr:hypothetical protein [Pedosphaera sp.]
MGKWPCRARPGAARDRVLAQGAIVRKAWGWGYARFSGPCLGDGVRWGHGRGGRRGPKGPKGRKASLGQRQERAREGTDRHEKARNFESVLFSWQRSLRTGSAARKWCLQRAPMRPINRSKPHETALARPKPLFQKFLFFCGHPTDGKGIRSDGPQRAGRNSGD